MKKQHPHYYLSNDMGIEWSETQIALIDALNTHNEIMIQCPRRQYGKTYALCGMIATLMRTYDKVFHIVLCATSTHGQLIKLKYIQEMYGSDRFTIHGNTICTPTVTVTIIKERVPFMQNVDLLLLDDADAIPPKFFFRDVIPLIQTQLTKIMYLHTDDVDYLTYLREQKDLNGYPFIHSVKISKEGC